MVTGSTLGREKIILELLVSSAELEPGPEEGGEGGGGGAVRRVVIGLTSGWRGGADLGTTPGSIKTNTTWSDTE